VINIESAINLLGIVIQ